MEKVLVEVYLPTVGTSFDAFLPPKLRISTVIECLKKIAVDITDKAFQPDDKTVLCDRISGSILDINMSVESLEIKNGSRLMLV